MSIIQNAFHFREFCRRNNICPETGYREVRAGRLEVVKVGRRSLVTAEAERRWIESLPRLRLGAAASASQKVSAADDYTG